MFEDDREGFTVGVGSESERKMRKGVLEVLTGRGEMYRERRRKTWYLRRTGIGADKKKMLPCSARRRRCWRCCENVRRIRSAVGGEAFLAHKVCEKADAAAKYAL